MTKSIYLNFLVIFASAIVTPIWIKLTEPIFISFSNAFDEISVISGITLSIVIFFLLNRFVVRNISSDNK